jgi:hypothetical protein
MSANKYFGINTNDLQMLRNVYLREAAAWRSRGNEYAGRYWSAKAGTATQELNRRENDANRRD